MKTTKDGKIKLSKGERRVGNFVYKKETNHIKVMDINDTFSVRLSNQTLMSGRLLDIQLQHKEDVFLGNYAAMLYNLCGLLPDEEFMVTMQEAAIACVNRHKEMYGIKEDLSVKEDAEILEDARKTQEAIEELDKQ